MIEDKESSMDDNKAKALKAALGQIEKQFGKNTIMHLGDNSAALDVDVVSTGSLGLDIALGIDAHAVAADGDLEGRFISDGIF